MGINSAPQNVPVPQISCTGGVQRGILSHMEQLELQEE